MRAILFSWLICLCAGAGSLAAQSPDVDAIEEEAFKAAAAIAEPSIVQIQTIGGLDVVGELIAGTGPTTGVIVSPDGEILTSSFNFASKPSSVIVTLGDGRKLAADVVATDQLRHVTLIRVKQSELKPISTAPRKELQVGQWTIALGRTYDPAFPNMSVGILSALNRIWGKAVQTDAKVSPANYGGPLIDLQGRCIGILVPISPDGADEVAGVEWYDAGIGFAVPLEEILPHLDTLRKGQNLRPGRMGVTYEDKGPVSGAAIAKEIRPNSPAEAAGMQSGDEIIRANGKPIERIAQMKTVLGPLAAGEKLDLVVKRGDQEVALVMTLAAEIPPFEFPMLGILPARNPDKEGVFIRHVLAGSPAAKAGLKVGDRIEQVDAVPVKSARQLSTWIENQRLGRSIKVKVLREGGTSEELSLELAPLAVAAPLDLVADLGAKAEDADVPQKRGRIDRTIPGTDGRKFWVYVPETVQPKQYGLVLWLHPEGRTGESEQLNLWRSACEERGLIFAGLLAEGSWSGQDGPLLKGLLDNLLKQYSIDSRRVVIMGEQEGGEFALFAATKLPDQIRAAIGIDAGLKIPPPENAVGKRQMYTILPRTGSQRFRVTRSTVSNLSLQKVPTWELAAPEEDGLDENTVKQLVLWIDSLDRI